MAYRFVLRKYKLPEEEERGYKARQLWEYLKQSMTPDQLEELVVDEFPIQDKPNHLQPVHRD